MNVKDHIKKLKQLQSDMGNTTPIVDMDGNEVTFINDGKVIRIVPVRGW